MAKIVLASHGDLAKGMLNSANMIIGNLTEDVEVYCLYPGNNPQDYADELRARIEYDNESWIILADILGGSVYTALSQLTVYDNVTIFSGMNLNLVLSVLIENDKKLDEEQMEKIAEDAKVGITCKKSISKLEEEDF